MTVRWFGLAAAVACGIGGTGGAGWVFGQQEPPAKRHVRIAATVLDEDGGAISRLPLLAGVTMDGFTARTDGAGGAMLEGEIPADAGKVWVRVFLGVKDGSLEQAQQDRLRFDEVISSWSFADEYPLALRPGVTDYRMTITGYRAVGASGHVVDGKGGPLGAVVCRLAGPWSEPTSGSDEHFRLGGVRKGRAAELVFASGDTAYVHIVTLRGAQTGADIDLGEVVFRAPPPEATVQVRVQNRGAFPRGREGTKRNSVTLVSADGGTVYVFLINDSNQAMRSLMDPVTDLHIARGTYYACPGWFSKDRTSGALRDALRAGRRAELDAAGVPKIVAQGDAPVEVKIDAAAAVAAVRRVGVDD